MTLYPKLKEKKHSHLLRFEEINTPPLPHFVFIFINNELLNFYKNLFTKV